MSLLPPPNTSFGHPLRSLWSLDPGIRFLNHGSFGAAPLHVLAAPARWREAMEREPVRFMVDELPPALLAARVRLAGFVGAVLQRLTFVDNATAGANAVLRSRRWRGCSGRALAQESRRLPARPLATAARRAGFSARRPVTYFCSTLAMRVW